MDEKRLDVRLVPYSQITEKNDYDIDRIIYDLDSQIGLLSSHGDKYDYLVSVGSGILCAMLDILWVGDLSLERGRDIASDKVDELVKKSAKMLGCKDDDLKSAVSFLEDRFSAPSDGNTPDFGGGLQHHLRDFAHHPTILGLIFSLLTQFSYKSYGTDKYGNFIVVNVPDRSKSFIGNDVPTKILYGTLIWFFHLVSDMAGSSGSVLKSGGTGIPGPILSLAKEMSAFPLFKNIKVKDNSMSVFISKLFNGTLLAKHDESGKIIKDTVLRFDLRGEFGIGIELGRQAIPVVANECIVRAFYFIRRFVTELRDNRVSSLDDMNRIDWKNVAPAKNPIIARMLTIATGIFTMLDVSEAVISQKYWVAVNYVGVGRFAVAIGEDVSWCLKSRDLKKIKQMYEKIKQNVFAESDNRIYERLESDMNDVNVEKFGLTLEQTEILYNLEYFKTLNDIEKTKTPLNTESIKSLKLTWLNEWKEYMINGFASFIQIDDAKLHWFNDVDELIEKVEENEPNKTWFRLTLLEAMLFEPYFPLGVEKDKKGNDVPSKKYRELQNIITGYKKNVGDDYLDSIAWGDYYAKGYIDRLRKCHDKVLRELNEVIKTVLTTVTITAVITVSAVATAGIFAPAIAAALVGSNFVGLSGVALTNACLAFLGGGAIAAGGFGMAGGTAVIVGGGAALGLGVGAGISGAVGAAEIVGKKNTIMQSAKLLVSIREIFLNDEQDIEYSNSVYEQYVQQITEIEKGLVELRLQADVASGEEKKKLKDKIKKEEDSVEAMKIARKSFLKFKSSFEVGLQDPDK